MQRIEYRPGVDAQLFVSLNVDIRLQLSEPACIGARAQMPQRTCAASYQLSMSIFIAPASHMCP